MQTMDPSILIVYSSLRKVH